MQVGLIIHPKTKLTAVWQYCHSNRRRFCTSDTDDVEMNPTLRGRERTNQRRTQLAAQTGHEDRSHEMRRQKKRETKRINRAKFKKERIEPPPATVRKNKDSLK